MENKPNGTMKVDGLGTPGTREVKVNYPGNSYTEKANPEKKKVINGKVVRKKKSLGNKIMDTFFNGSLDSVVPNLVTELLIPRMQDILLDMVSDGLDMLFHGDSARRRGSSYSNPRGRVNYSERYRTTSQVRRPAEPRRRDRIDFDQIILEDQYDAREVLRNMRDMLARYDQVTIADLCDALDITSNYTDNAYGWLNLDTARIRRVSDGWLIDLPDPIPLD